MEIDYDKCKSDSYLQSKVAQSFKLVNIQI